MVLLWRSRMGARNKRFIGSQEGAEGTWRLPSLCRHAVRAAGRDLLRDSQHPCPCKDLGQEEFFRTPRGVGWVVVSETDTAPEICSQLNWPTVTHS